MGRHSIPDPDDSGRDSRTPASDRSVTTTPTEYEAAEHDGRRPRPRRTEADDVRRDEPVYRPRHRDARRPGLSRRRYRPTRITLTADYRDADVLASHRDIGLRRLRRRATTTDHAIESPTTPGTAATRRRLQAAAHGGEWEGGEWTGSHRAVDAPGRRGVSIGVIVALVTVVVVVGASSCGGSSATRCPTAPMSPPRAAWTVTSSVAVHRRPVDRRPDHDARRRITTRPPRPSAITASRSASRPPTPTQSSTASSGQWPAELGERPALWIPGSSVSAARLEAAAGAQTISDSRSLVTSPVVLAVQPELKDALAQQNWATLPGLQTNPSGAGRTEPARLGIAAAGAADHGDSDATYLAAEAVAAAAAPAGAPPTRRCRRGRRTLWPVNPSSPTTSRRTAMDALLQGDDPAAAPVHAVVTTEQQLYPARRGAVGCQEHARRPGCRPGRPRWPTFRRCCCPATGLPQEQVSAASEFDRFMRKPDSWPSWPRPASAPTAAQAADQRRHRLRGAAGAPSVGR